MGGGRKVDKTTRKSEYFVKMAEFLAVYNKILLVNADNVGSFQMQQIRQALRGDAIIFMGKNTLMKKAIRGYLEHNPDLERLIPFIKNNVGMVFSHLDLVYIRNKLLENKKAAPAKTGAIAPLDVHLPKGSCGLGPEKTGFFQNLSIPTKITRGQIELTNDFHLIRKNCKVGASEATLLNMLNISPFSYGLKVVTVYDKGSIYKADLLDLTTDDVMGIVEKGIANLNATALGMGYPLPGTITHSLTYGFRNILSVALGTDISFKEADAIKTILSDPEAMAKLQTSAKPAAKQADVVEQPADEPAADDSESGSEGIGGLFD
ncbi:60S acidic ribosomal protein P0-like [Oopsacas minuta]|uniref:60S acidic ribosomal protein P0 n=1 Tax=Oopsacas minuta TaxID=111878 RepID=A0AAV7KKV8_9METZ|nr:60S acidic ribosomal protein P0-like [Oopsacas minuta]